MVVVVDVKGIETFSLSSFTSPKKKCGFRQSRGDVDDKNSDSSFALWGLVVLVAVEVVVAVVFKLLLKYVFAETFSGLGDIFCGVPFILVQAFWSHAIFILASNARPTNMRPHVWRQLQRFHEDNNDEVEEEKENDAFFFLGGFDIWWTPLD
jgi:hypothetical protein